MRRGEPYNLVYSSDAESNSNLISKRLFLRCQRSNVVLAHTLIEDVLDLQSHGYMERDRNCNQSGVRCMSAWQLRPEIEGLNGGSIPGRGKRDNGLWSWALEFPESHNSFAVDSKISASPNYDPKMIDRTSTMQILASTSLLQQRCCSPALFRDSFLRPGARRHYDSSFPGVLYLQNGRDWGSGDRMDRNWVPDGTGMIASSPRRMLLPRMILSTGCD